MPLELKEPTFDRPFEEIYRELRVADPALQPAVDQLQRQRSRASRCCSCSRWLAEMTLHRMNDVPRKNYLKFAQLLGPAAAAARGRPRCGWRSRPRPTEPPATIAAGSRFGAQAAAASRWCSRRRRRST